MPTLAELIAAVDREKAEARAAQYGIPKVYTDVAEIDRKSVV